MATLDSLSSEIIDLIIKHLGLGGYAAISRTWQCAVERYTFRHIAAYSDELPRLQSLVGQDPRRLSLLQTLSYKIDLPLHSLNRRRNFERRREHQANLVAFRQEVVCLWTELAAWQDEDSLAPSQDLNLVLVAEVPLYRGRDDLPWWEILGPGLGCECWAHPEHSLSLDNSVDGPPSLPVLPRVTNLIIARSGRRIHPTAIQEILVSLPNLRFLDLTIWPVKPKNKAIRAEMRDHLARALDAPSLEKLEILRITMDEWTPCNHNFMITDIQDPNYPDGDHLNRAVCKLVQTSLRELHLLGEYMISPVLWGLDGENPDRETNLFPHLQKLEVRFPIITYDGRWYYTGDPRCGMDDQDFEDEDDDDDGFGGGQTPSSTSSDTDSCSSTYLNGVNPQAAWRTSPDPAMFDPLIKGLVSAAARMPELVSLRASTTNLYERHGSSSEL
ncbi:hypothetical protein BJX99DRAFT_251913 [Aspergillus californicus]